MRGGHGSLGSAHWAHGSSHEVEHAKGAHHSALALNAKHVVGAEAGDGLARGCRAGNAMQCAVEGISDRAVEGSVDLRAPPRKAA